MWDWILALFRRSRTGDGTEDSETLSAEVDAAALWEQLGDCAEGAPLLVDVRTANEYEAEHISGSRLLPLSVLEERCGELPREQLIVLICRAGTLSQAACELLARRGFVQVNNLHGGLSSWKRAGLPYVTGCNAIPSGSAETDTGTAAASNVATRAGSLRRATQ